MSEMVLAGDSNSHMDGQLVRARPLYVVGIGASAGGLEALEQFFDHVPVDSGMAFVVVQHLSPDFKSLMDEILSRRTKLPVRLVEDGVLVLLHELMQHGDRPVKIFATDVHRGSVDRGGDARAVRPAGWWTSACPASMGSRSRAACVPTLATVRCT
jgi:CheB methylesterase